ncbi:18898_t:CDS:2, partial [Acaulospora morrowiae]
VIVFMEVVIDVDVENTDNVLISFRRDNGGSGNGWGWGCDTDNDLISFKKGGKDSG